MKRFWYILVFVIALAAFAAARAPASLLAQPREGFAYARATGTVWDAALEDARLGPYRVGRVTWRISPFDLIQGRVIAPLRFEGEIEGEAILLGNWSNDRRIQIPQMRIEGLALAGAMLPGETQMRGLDLFFENGACARAEGAASTDVLARAGAALGFNGPALSGAARCEGADAVVAMSGENPGAERVSLTLRLEGNGAGQWRLAVQNINAETQAALIAVGFQRDAQTGELDKGERLTWLPF